MISSENFSYKISSLNFGARKILSNISFELNPAEITSILGKNGAGKTSLLRTILEQNELSAFDIKLRGENLGKINVHRKAKLISHLGSSDFSKPDLSVGRFLEICAEISNSGDNRNLDNNLHEDLKFWKIESLYSSNLSQLSEGEFQRVLLLSVFRQEAKMYMFDEPERHLDPEGVLLFQKKCLEKKMEGKIILLVTHDILLSIVLSDNILGLSENGEKQFFLPKEICLNERRLDDLFNVSFKVFRDEEENIQALSVNMIGENIGGEGA